MQKSENRIRQQDKDRRICHRFPICSQKAMIKNKEIQSIQLEIQDFTASEIHEHFTTSRGRPWSKPNIHRLL
jgi:hypothetical protein